MNVLLVDDSPSVRSILKVYLMGRRTTFLEADDGERALRVLRLSPVDLVIADVQMVPMDGITFLRHLRSSSLPKLRDIPVVMLTSDRSAEVRERGLAAGASAFVHKPVDARTLLRTIADVMPGGGP